GSAGDGKPPGHPGSEESVYRGEVPRSSHLDLCFLHQSARKYLRRIRPGTSCPHTGARGLRQEATRHGDHADLLHLQVSNSEVFQQRQGSLRAEQVRRDDAASGCAERTRVACAAVGPDFQELGQELHIYRKKLNEIVKNVRAAKEQQDEYDPMTIDLSPIDDKVTKLSVALDSMIDGHTSVGKADEEEVKGFEDLFMQTQSGLRQAWELRSLFFVYNVEPDRQIRYYHYKSFNFNLLTSTLFSDKYFSSFFLLKLFNDDCLFFSA
ncbi:unnamed protein product, partial [Symbiodinium microadriaticum]